MITLLQCEKLRAEAGMLPGIRAELDALRRRHSAALELMGERDEEVYIFVFLFALKSIIELSLCNMHVLWTVMPFFLSF